jgi:hypothetical protein
MLATILHTLFVIIAIAFLIGWYLFIKKIRRNKPDMPTEKLILIALASLLLLLSSIFYISNSFETTKWKGLDLSFNNENQEEIHDFTHKVYKPLVSSLERVDAEIKNMNILLEDIDDLIDGHPRHAVMLSHAKKTWQDGAYALRKKQRLVQKDIRRAWIAHDTKNQQTVDIKFSREAVKLDKRINLALRKFRELIINVHAMIRRDLSYSQKKLGRKNQQTDEVLPPIAKYTTELTGKLLTFSKTIHPSIHAGMEKLLDEIAITEQRQEKNKQHLEENKDLTEPLIKVIDYWKEAERQNRDYFDQSLYALESALLGRKLGLKNNDYGIKSMKKMLKKQIPLILKRVQNKRNKIDNSY